MNEMQEKNLKRLKLANMIALVITAISIVSGLITIPRVLHPSIYKSKIFGKEGMVLYEFWNHPFVKIFTILTVIITIVFLVLFFLSNKQIKEKQLPKKSIYYFYLLLSLIQLIYNLVFALKNTLKGSSSNLVIMSIIYTLILNLPAILAIVYIFKLEEANN
ncbi:MAG: hypothetical protein LBS28_02875 [Streptococcaceae bacterium]|jgi:hypothetical protein|nr:hypothetical protein [Streptococcaceae bacterium]